MRQEEMMSTQTKALTPRVLVSLFVVVFVFPLLPMIISGDWSWWEAWIYALISSLGFVVSRALAARRHPDILEERARSMDLKDAKPWDKILAPGLAFGSLLILIVTGLFPRDPIGLSATLVMPAHFGPIWPSRSCSIRPGPSFQRCYWLVSWYCGLHWKTRRCGKNCLVIRNLPGGHVIV
jgi:hypothetical protein